MANWRIHVLDTGGFFIDKSVLTYLKDAGKQVECITPVFYLEGSRKVLVDTSFSTVEAAARLSPGSKVWRDQSQEIEAALASVGVMPSEVEFVILTHLHFDHCGNNRLFPQARFLIQREELRYAAAPDPVQEMAYSPICRGMHPDYLGTSFEVVEGEVVIAPGLVVVPVPGHTPGSQAVLVESGGKMFGIAGDLLPLEENINSLIPAGIHTDIASWYRSARMLMSRCDVVIPGHDKSYRGTFGG